MFKKTKKIFTAILSAVLAVSMIAAPVYANGIDARAVIVEPGIEPQWQNVGATAAALSFNGSTISISFVVTAYSGTTFSSGTVFLIKLTGSDTGIIKKWSGLSSNTNYFSFDDNSQTVTSTGTYRVLLLITATRNGVSETITAKKDRTY